MATCSHLNLILDNQPYTSIYDLHQPLAIANLSPGTHTLKSICCLSLE